MICIKVIQKLIQEGSDGKKIATYLVRKENGVKVGQSVIEETILEEPKDHIVLKGTKVIPSRGSGHLLGQLKVDIFLVKWDIVGVVNMRG